MEPLVYQSTEDTPEINLDYENGVLEFSGKSLPEDVLEFYSPVLDWIDRYCSSPKDLTIINIKFYYFNTSSSKIIMDMLSMFEDMVEQGKDVKVNWFYQKDDFDMMDAGEEMADLVDVPFEISPIS